MVSYEIVCIYVVIAAALSLSVTLPLSLLNMLTHTLEQLSIFTILGPDHVQARAHTQTHLLLNKLI